MSRATTLRRLEGPLYGLKTRIQRHKTGNLTRIVFWRTAIMMAEPRFDTHFYILRQPWASSAKTGTALKLVN